MTEVRFYHLTRQSLADALPVMLDRTLARGGRAVVRGARIDGLRALGQRLWTWRDESFLAHGIDGDEHAGHQPIWLTVGKGVPNGARTLFIVMGGEAAPEECADFDLVARVFDGNDPDELQAARASWRALRGTGHETVYWAESDSGGWEKKATS